jgi:lipoprotein-anchoring transpeptidase ErfK/SrfK
MSRLNINLFLCQVATAVGIFPALTSTVFAEPLALANANDSANSIFQPVIRYPSLVQRAAEEPKTVGEVPARLRRQMVNFPTNETSGSIVIDTPNTYLYYVLGAGKAIRYGIGVGRDGFRWSGVKSVAKKAEWPDWIPPAEMLARQPYLPRFMAGGDGNPLGARAIYLGGTIYRIHGTNQPSTIGGRVSSGCIRMANEDVIDLYGRVQVGTKVVVLPDQSPAHDLRAWIKSTSVSASSLATVRVRTSSLH